VMDSFADAINWIGDNWANGMDWMAKAMLAWATTASWVWNNLNDITYIVMSEIILKFTELANIITHFLTVNLGEIALGAFKVFGNIVEGAMNGTIENFTIMVDNLKELWRAFKTFVTTGTWEPNLKPITTAFMDEIDVAMPEVTSRTTTAFEEGLKARILQTKADLAKAYGDEVAAPMAELESMQAKVKSDRDARKYTEPPVPTPPGGDQSGPGQKMLEPRVSTKAADILAAKAAIKALKEEPGDSGKFGSSIMQKGSSSAYSGVLAAMGQERQDRVQKDQLTELKAIEARLAMLTDKGFADEKTGAITVKL
jgi:hypothetical protein